MISILMEKNYEYNDEINYFTEGGKIITAFSDPIKAQEALEEYYKKWSDDHELRDFCYSSDDFDIPDDIEWDEMNLWQKNNPEKVLDILKNELKPYYLVQCELL